MLLTEGSCRTYLNNLSCSLNGKLKGLAYYILPTIVTYYHKDSFENLQQIPTLTVTEW